MMYAITGVGIKDYLGEDLDSNFKKLLANTSSPRPMSKADWVGYSYDVTLSTENVYSFSPIEKKDIVLLDTKLKREEEITYLTGLTIKQALDMSQPDLNNKIVGIVGSTLFADRQSANTTWNRLISGKSKSSPAGVMHVVPEALVSWASRALKIKGPSVSISNTCTSSISSLDYACKYLGAGDVDVMVVSCIDMPTDQFVDYLFSNLGAVSKLGISRPFDSNRDGMVLGDASASVIVERYEDAKRRGAPIFGIIKGIGQSTENLDPISPEMSMGGYQRAFDLALSKSGIAVDDIAFINGHATSTILGDAVEYNIFKDSGIEYITSCKGHVGHTMAASGLVESIYSLKCLHEKVVNPVANLTATELEGNLKIVTQATSIEKKHVLKNSYGFGGKCASMILGIE
jgi:3-oxoacyl-[acyl-carrier-protein] synthase II